MKRFNKCDNCLYNKANKFCNYLMVDLISFTDVLTCKFFKPKEEKEI